MNPNTSISFLNFQSIKFVLTVQQLQKQIQNGLYPITEQGRIPVQNWNCVCFNDWDAQDPKDSETYTGYFVTLKSPENLIGNQLEYFEEYRAYCHFPVCTDLDGETLYSDIFSGCDFTAVIPLEENLDYINTCFNLSGSTSDAGDYYIEISSKEKDKTNTPVFHCWIDMEGNIHFNNTPEYFFKEERKQEQYTFYDYEV